MLPSFILSITRYHCEFLDTDSAARPPLPEAERTRPRCALLVIRRSEELRWFVPLGASSTRKVEWQLMGSAYSRIKHLQAMGFQKLIVVRLDEWRKLAPEDRVPHLIQCESGSPTGPVMSISDFDVGGYD